MKKHIYKKLFLNWYLLFDQTTDDKGTIRRRGGYFIRSNVHYRRQSHNLIGMKRIYMMENAGHGVADFIILKFKRKLRGKQIVAICGTGNNGGDGFVASRHLSYYYGARLRLVLLGFPNDLRTEEARI